MVVHIKPSNHNNKDYDINHIGILTYKIREKEIWNKLCETHLLNTFKHLSNETKLGKIESEIRK